MLRPLCPSLAVAALLALAGCGGEPPADDRLALRTPPLHAGAEPLAEVAQAERKAERDAAALERGLRRPAPVLRGWGEALTRNDTDRAARYFELPAVVANDAELTLETPGQVKAFVSGLDCGVRLLHVQPGDRFVIGTYRQVERPAHDCAAPGELIRIAFLLHDRKIAEWRRVQEVVDPDATPTPEPTPKAPRPGVS